MKYTKHEITDYSVFLPKVTVPPKVNKMLRYVDNVNSNDDNKSDDDDTMIEPSAALKTKPLKINLLSL